MYRELTHHRLHMKSSPSKEPVEEVVRRTIESNTSMVGKWVVGQPGSWGFLSGKAVIAYRQTLGRTLTDPERREVWDLLWKCLGACPTILEEKPLPGPRESCGNLMRPSWPGGVPVGSATPVLNRLRPLGPGTCLAYPVGASPARQSFRRLWVRAIRVNSPATLSRPRSRNCRKPRACLISP